MLFERSKSGAARRVWIWGLNLGVWPLLELKFKNTIWVLTTKSSKSKLNVTEASEIRKEILGSDTTMGPSW